MKPRIYKRLGPLFVNLGWFHGEPFALFKFTVGEVLEDYPEGIASVVIFDVQVTKALFCVGWSRD